MSWSSRATLADVARGLAAARSAGWWPKKALMFHDLEALESRLAALIAAFPNETVHGIAIKANPLIELLRVVVDAGGGLEAASWEEVQCALAAGCPPDRLVFDSPAKTDEELSEALRLGLWLNADNEGELERLATLGAPSSARIGLRVNPAIGAGSIGHTSTVSRDSKFGELIERAPDLVKRFPFITGLHVHTGSQGVGLALLEAAARATGEVVEALDLDWIDVGGGLPVRYTNADPEPPSVKAWADALAKLPFWGRRTIVTELGRALHAGTGWAVSRIEAVKVIDGTPLYVIHLGADLLLRPVYRPEAWSHELFVLRPDGTPREGSQKAHVGGPLCFAGDIIARDRDLPPAEPGDLLVIRDTGAYTLSMWSRHCSRGLPPVVGLRDQKIIPLFAGERPADVVRAWSLRS